MCHQLIIVLIVLASTVNAHKYERALPKVCVYRGNIYPEGEFKPTPCEFCKCQRGKATCAIADCFFTNCVDPKYDPTKCCPECPNGPNCLTPDNVTLAAGETHVMENGVKCKCDVFGTKAVCSGCNYMGKQYPVGGFKPSPCMHCSCPSDGGKAICAIQDCAAPPCQNPVRLPDQCCSVCNTIDFLQPQRKDGLKN